MTVSTIPRSMQENEFYEMEKHELQMKLPKKGKRSGRWQQKG